MQTTRKTTENKTRSKVILSKEEAANTKKDEKKKIAVTPRNYLQKASTTDIYGQKNAQPKAPSKSKGTTKISSSSPMKNLLKSSSSSVSQISRTSYNEKDKPGPYSAKTPKSDQKKSTPRLAKDLPFSNVTVNSPGVKKKLDLNVRVDNIKNKKEIEIDSAKIKKKLEASDKDGASGRQRTKTRTLQEDEVKVLTPEVVDNNIEMMKLTQKLAAKPKVFYVDLDEGQAKPQTEKASDEEISYEDDFESYESDFDSYHSSHTEQSSNPANSDIEHNDNLDSDDHQSQYGKENEEKMLDSGNFDLREAQRSANVTKPALGFIQEDSEADVKVSLTDEGFQEMSSSSTASSMKTVHVDVLDRPLFIDFSKGKENKRKRRIFENLKQRAKDILNIVTLHEMTYTLFEMKPIPYDLFMATFGRSNYMQIAVQTFEDGISQEIQTEDIEYDEKWTQHPIEFSNHDIYLKDDTKKQNYSKNSEDYLSKLTLLINAPSDDVVNNQINTDLNYKTNPLRIYFEQRDGVGNCEMLPYEMYKSKLRNNEFNANKLRIFLKKVERRISHVLSLNTSDQEMADVVRSSKFPFSKGYVSLSNKNITDEKFAFVKYAKITNVVFSDTKNNLIMTVHKRCASSMDRCIACLWDLSIARRDPIKIIIAIDNITIARLRGNTDGIFAAALEDGSIHLWDLTEKATWRNVASEEKPTNLVEVRSSTPLTQTEKDRDWNLKNSNVGYDTGPIQSPMQACSFTSSAVSVNGGAAAGRVVGLEMGWHGTAEGGQGRKVLGQVCSLQNIGILSIWAIIQEKLGTSFDMGKAFWSKLKLEIKQRISLTDHLNVPKPEPLSTDIRSNFNLNAAKKRNSMRKREQHTIKKISRPKSAASFDSDRSSSITSARSARSVMPTENNWENGIVCNDLKIMNYDNQYSFLIAKNCGEVLCCSRTGGVFKVNEFQVSTDTSTVTSLEVSTHGLPYFLAATDSGTVNLCSVLHSRVLLTLDCRNHPPNQEAEKYHAHQKGHFVGSVVVKTTSTDVISISSQVSISSVLWSTVNPCCVFARLKNGRLVVWDLAHSDIQAKCAFENAATAASAGNGVLMDRLMVSDERCPWTLATPWELPSALPAFYYITHLSYTSSPPRLRPRYVAYGTQGQHTFPTALVTPDGEVQIHRVGNEHQAKQHRDLFSKYAALL